MLVINKMEKGGDTIYDASNKQLKAVKDCKDLKKIKSKLEALDLSQNMLVSLKGLDGFSRLKVLNLDHNFLTSLDSLPSLPKLDTLSLNYNRLGDTNNVVKNIIKRCPCILHLSLLKNPINPSAEKEDKYEEFRETFRRCIKTLQSLDGADFEGSRVVLPGILGGKSGLEPILEDAKSSATKYDPFQGGTDKSRSKAQTMAAGKGTGKLSYNHKAYKKYNSSRSLAERILKSNSEGNRFIKNDDL